ncbi:MAG: hypothetical protein ACD_12C00801G0002 [uncultured bacterium]|nr:MAG: hypothetical protein ACD_12C00801G0002 [uncultured bacterium]
MSGHSKWSQIKRKKGIKDAARGKLFSKISQVITIAITSNGGITDPLKNARLRLAIEKAKEIGMPKENILRAIQKAQDKEGQNLKEVIYEGFSSQGVALLIVGATDNTNRMLSEVRKTLEKHKGKLGASNSITHFFKKCAIVIFDKTVNQENQIFEFVDKIKAEDIEENENSYTLYTPFEKIGLIQELLGDLKTSTIDIYYRPISQIPLQNKQEALDLINLIEALEELGDVNKVYANFDIYRWQLKLHRYNAF